MYSLIEPTIEIHDFLSNEVLSNKSVIERNIIDVFIIETSFYRTALILKSGFYLILQV